MDNLFPIIALIIGLALGAGLVWLVLKGRIAGAVGTAQADVASLNDELRKETAARAAAEEKNSRIALLETELENRDASIREASGRLELIQREATELIKTRAELQTTLDQERLQTKQQFEQERQQNKQQLEQLQSQHEELRRLDQKQSEERIADLNRQRKELIGEFENLANKILEDKRQEIHGTEQDES